MRAKLVRNNCAAVKEAPDRDDQNVFPANTLAGKHMALLLKMYEEIDEIARDATNPEEYADLLEAMLELSSINGVRWDEIEAALLDKRADRGGFKRGMIWTVDVPSPRRTGTMKPKKGEEDHIDWDKVNDLNVRSDSDDPGQRAGFPPAMTDRYRIRELEEALRSCEAALDGDTSIINKYATSSALSSGYRSSGEVPGMLRFHTVRRIVKKMLDNPC